jgi:hypothetical protein
VPDADDGRAYRFADADLVKCADCRKELPHDTKLCPDCGFNLETGQKAVKTYTELNRAWEAGMPFARRRNLLILAEIIIVPMVVFGALTTGYWQAFLWPWLWFTFLAGFLLGTFDRLDLTRDGRGKVRLTKTWHVFFLRRQPQMLRLSEYEGIATGPADRSIMDWVICFLLLPAGLVPAIIFWYLVLLQDNFHVSLTQHHGFPEMPLYQGSNQNHIREIAETLHEVAGLPFTG